MHVMYVHRRIPFGHPGRRHSRVCEGKRKTSVRDRRDSMDVVTPSRVGQFPNDRICPRVSCRRRRRVRAYNIHHRTTHGPRGGLPAVNYERSRRFSLASRPPSTPRRRRLRLRLRRDDETRRTTTTPLDVSAHQTTPSHATADCCRPARLINYLPSAPRHAYTYTRRVIRTDVYTS